MNFHFLQQFGGACLCLHILPNAAATDAARRLSARAGKRGRELCRDRASTQNFLLHIRQARTALRHSWRGSLGIVTPGVPDRPASCVGGVRARSCCQQACPGQGRYCCHKSWQAKNKQGGSQESQQQQRWPSPCWGGLTRNKELVQQQRFWSPWRGPERHRCRRNRGGCQTSQS